MRATRVDQVASGLAAIPSGSVLRAVDRATTLGNGTVVWAVSTLGLGAAGRRGRRAALEAALAYVSASVTSNGVVKPLVDRERPWRGLRRPRKPSSSFPSSHATTSFAYATAATASWPAAGAPLLLLAAAVAASRVHARHHRISEVTGGALLGAVIGATVHAGVRARTRS
ncbi:MAG: phosphatase PAP2 family protein [Acidimicrobiia bacterium]|nr:phosphatase PAP2 family protein [Acidimicrobiia bacterium]